MEIEKKKKKEKEMSWNPLVIANLVEQPEEISP